MSFNPTYNITFFIYIQYKRMHHFGSFNTSNGGVIESLAVAPPLIKGFKKVQAQPTTSSNENTSPISTRSYRNSTIPQSPVSSSGSSSNNSIRWSSIRPKNNNSKNIQQQPPVDKRRESFVAMSTQKLSLFNRWKNQTLIDTALEGISEEVMYNILYNIIKTI